MYNPPTPGVAATNYFDDDMGGMDGETGEWFPSSSYKRREETNQEEKKEEEAAQEDSDSGESSSGESEEYSERRTKEVAKEFLDTSLNSSDQDCDSSCDQGPSTSFSPCRMLLNGVGASYIAADAETGQSRLSNGNAMFSETGEIINSCNGITDLRMSKELANCALAT